MSFDYNPYEHIEVVTKDDGFIIHCHSCGGDRPKPPEGPLPADTPISYLFNLMARHVLESHGRLPIDFAGWSKY